MDVHSTISIASINLKPPHLQILKFIIPYYFKEHFSLTQKKEARVQVVEINSNNIFDKINEHKKQYPDAFFIIISPHNEVDDNFFVISPPVSPKKISDALYYVSDKLSKLAQKKIKDNNNKKETIIKKIKPKKILKSEKKIKKPTIQNKEKPNEQQKRKALLDKKYNFYLDLDSYTENLKFDKSKNIEPPKRTIDKKKSELDLEQNINTNTKNLIEIDKDKLSFMSSRPDVDLNKLDFISKITYKTEDYLQGGLVKLYKSARFNTLLTSYCTITYQAENNTAYISVNNRTLQSISSIGSLSTHYSSVNIDTLKNDKEIQWEDADIILWKVTIWSSRGRLPSGFNDIDQTITLINWPNFTRLMMIPYAMEIAALWVDKPISLRNSITSLNIPQRYIFSLYSAAISLDLIVFEKNKNKNNKLSSNLATSSNNKKRKNILGKLLTFFKPDNIKDI